MKRAFISVLVAVAFLSACAVPTEKKVILAILAHPDDEHAIGPLLVKYARTDKVHLIIATDGRLGTKPGFPTGEELVVLRETESKCACALFGIEAPVFLRFPDGFDTRDGVGPYLDQSAKLKAALTKKIKEIGPDLIITFGPDGDTGHSDHRMISNMTTEVVLKEGWAEKIPLYYLGWTSKDSEKFQSIGGLNVVDPKYLNVTIRYSQEEEEIAMKALECTKSQLSEEEMKEWELAEKNDPANVLRFRQLTVPNGTKTGF